MAALVFSALHRWIKGKASVPVSAGVAAVAGTLTNTILVLGLLVLIYPDSMGTDASRVFSVILTSIVAVNGIVEILSAVVLAIPVSAALFKLQQRLALPQAPTKKSQNSPEGALGKIEETANDPAGSFPAGSFYAHEGV